MPISRSVARYQPRSRDDNDVIVALKAVSEAHPCWGFDKLCAIKGTVTIRGKTQHVEQVACVEVESGAMTPFCPSNI